MSKKEKSDDAERAQYPEGAQTHAADTVGPQKILDKSSIGSRVVFREIKDFKTLLGRSLAFYIRYQWSRYTAPGHIYFSSMKVAKVNELVVS